MENSKKPFFFNENELPVKAPAAADAWEKMKEKLAEEMPVKEKKRRRFLLFLFTILVGIVILSLLLVKTKSPAVTRKENTIAENEIQPASQTNKPKAYDQSASNLPPFKNNLTQALTQHDIPTVKEYSNKLTDKTNSTNTRKYLTSNKNQVNTYSGAATNTDNIASDSAGLHDEGIANQHIGSSVKVTLPNKDLIESAPTVKKENKEEEKEDKQTEDTNKIKVNGGLQWNFQIPLKGASYYFTTTNLKSGPWQNFVPGIWISFSKDRQELTAELNPYFIYLLPAKALNESKISSGNADTAIYTTKLSEINKLAGTAINFSYGYNLKSAWWIQAGIQAQWWRKGITTNNITQEKIAITNPAQPLIMQYKESHSTTIEELDYINKFQVNINAGLQYQRDKWQAAIRTGLPIAPISQTGTGPSRSLRTEFIFRWTLFTKLTNSSK